MNFHTRVSDKNARHVHLTVFANDAYCGRLTMTVEEFDAFRTMLITGMRYVPGAKVQFSLPKEIDK